MKVLQYTWSSHHNRSLRQRCIQWASTNTKTQDEALTRGNNKVGILILLRHGQSQWNVTDAALGTTARFTGWTDIPLTFRGVQQAVAAGHSINTFFQRTQPESHLQTKHVPLDAAFCSLLSRSRDTLTLCLQQLDLVVGYPPSDTILAPTASSTVLPSFKSMVTPPLDKKNMDSSIRYKIPIVSSWRLNERHYGALVGLSKEGAERLYGQTQLKKWRGELFTFYSCTN
jgi:bisphosphoglycerate-dependent phosphoglycerate mutase